MNNLEALYADVPFGVSQSLATKALHDRGLNASDEYEKSEAFELTTADLLMKIALSPSSISEGGYSISISNPKLLVDAANVIYRKYGVDSPLPNSGTASDTSFRW